MGLVREEVFVNLLTNSPEVREAESLYYVRGLRQELRSAVNLPVDQLLGRIDRPSALRVYRQIRQYIGDHGYLRGKYLRPWNLDPGLYDLLDRREAWWGFEFETGWNGVVSRRQAVHHTWDTWDNVVFDSEGEGSAVEITFAPQEMSKYLDGTADAYQFARYLTNNPNTHRGPNDAVGTHINVSHPLMTQDNVRSAAVSMNRTVAHLPLMDGELDVRKEFFGRSRLYGGFFVGVGAQTWLEGKLFRTTYEMQQFDQYVRVCKALTDSLVAILQNGEAGKTQDRPTVFVDNLYEMVTEGAAPHISFSRFYGNIDGTRDYENRINGALARDRHDEFAVEPQPPVANIYFEDVDDEPWDDDEDDF